MAGHTYERAAQPISIEDRAECRIGGSFLADDFKKLCEFSCGFMGEPICITGPFEPFRTYFSNPMAVLSPLERADEGPDFDPTALLGARLLT